MTIHLQHPAAWEAQLIDWAERALDSGTPVHHIVTDNNALAAAYAICDSITEEHSKTFYIASGLLPAMKRQSVRALYAFCRVTDDIVDRAEPGSNPQTVRAALEVWRTKTLHPRSADTLRVQQSYQAVALAWADTRARSAVPVGYAEQLIDGVGGDITKKRYQTFEELAGYAYGVASTVGLMAMHIIGFEQGKGNHALPYAVKLGIALQLTNILRDVAEDWRGGRLYLPLDELAAHNITEADIDAGRVDDRWRAFMRHQIARTHHLFDAAMPGIAMLHPEGRFSIAAAAELYRAILDDIEDNDYDVFSRRAHVSKWGKLRRLPGIFWRSRAGYPTH